MTFLTFWTNRVEKGMNSVKINFEPVKDKKI